MGNNSSALEPLTLRIEGMTCSSCVASIERVLNELPGVTATVNFATETAHVMVPAEMNSKELIGAIKSAGYTAREISDTSQVALHSKKSAWALFMSVFF